MDVLFRATDFGGALTVWQQRDRNPATETTGAVLDRRMPAGRGIYWLCGCLPAAVANRLGGQRSESGFASMRDAVESRGHAQAGPGAGIDHSRLP